MNDRRRTTWITLLLLALLYGCASLENEGDEFAAQGKWRHALKKYEQALAAGEESPDLNAKRERTAQEVGAGHYRRGQGHMEAGEYPQAVRAFREALRYQALAEAEVAQARALAEEAQRLLAVGEVEEAYERAEEARALSSAAEIVAVHEEVGRALRVELRAQAEEALLEEAAGDTEYQGPAPLLS